MFAGADDNVQVARRRAHRAGIAASGQANALAIARAGLDAHLQRFRTFHAAFPMTGWADGAVLAAAAAARTGNVELHTAALLRDVSLAVALRTFAGLLDKALPATMSADLEARNVKLQLGALDRLPEADVDLIFQVGAGLGMLHRLGCAAPVEDAGEDIAETTAAAAGAPSGSAGALFSEIGEVEAAEVKRNFLGIGARSAGARACALARTSKPACAEAATASVRLGRRGINVVRVEAELVVDLALLGIAEDVVGLGDLLELLLGRLVPRIHVGVVLAREFAERLADLLRRRGLLDPEVAVIIFLGCGGHV